MEEKRDDVDQVRAALRERGYREADQYKIPKRAGDPKPVTAFTLYTNNRIILVLQEWEDGDCELYKPVADTIEVSETIEAIPD